MLRIHFTVGLFKCKSEVAGVTFSDSDSAPIPKFLNPGSGSWSGNSSNLRIRLLFRLRLQSLIQPNFTHVFT